MTEEKEELQTYKVLLLGDSTVGKSCLLLQYIKRTFQESYLTSLGIVSENKEIRLEDGRGAILQICDTVGQERFRAITRNYFKKANGIVLMYDVTNLTSFKNIQNWISQINENVTESVIIILIGNKIDLEESRVVKYEVGKKVADEYKIQFFETSAKTGENIEQCFIELTKALLDKGITRRKTIKLRSSYGEKKKVCC